MHLKKFCGVIGKVRVLGRGSVAFKFLEITVFIIIINLFITLLYLQTRT
jgi:hypothetical protein